MSEHQTIAAAYIATWNETDADKRRALLDAHWNETADYVDPLMAGRGRDEVGGLISAVHERFPGFRFALVGTADGYADKVRFSWGLGPAGDPSVIMGSDVVLMEGGRIASVIGFLDRVPAAA